MHKITGIGEKVNRDLGFIGHANRGGRDLAGVEVAVARADAGGDRSAGMQNRQREKCSDA